MSNVLILNSGDLHLYDREIGATVGYKDESTRNLITLRDTFRESNCLMHFLGGDIQHGMPTNLRLMSVWRSILTEMREDVRERLIESGIADQIKVYDHEDKEVDFLNDVSCLFSVKGNHDYNRREDRETSFTFFDDLVKSGIIYVPKKVIIKDTQINFYSSEECRKPIPKDDGIEAVIGIYHDPILQNGRLADRYMGNKMISPDEHKFFNGVDIAVLNDIHTPIEPYEVVTVDENNVGTRTLVITHGSIGRTSFSDSHKRDVAYLTEIEIADGGELSYSLKEMPLLPYLELFDYERVVKVKRRENIFGEFSLEIDKIDKVKGDPRDEIVAMDIDLEVKKSCLELLSFVMNDEESDYAYMVGSSSNRVGNEDLEGTEDSGDLELTKKSEDFDDDFDASLGLF